VNKLVRTGVAATALALAVGLAAPSAALAAAPHTRPQQAAAQALPPYSTWIADVSAVAEQASAYLDSRLPDPKQNPAIVLDIDNTALESTYSPGFVVPATKPVLAVALQAKKLGAAVYFVTARPDFLRLWTQFNLTQAGYPVDGIYLKSGFVSDQAQKTAARIAIEKLGHTIVANIGNNDTDLAGGHAEKTFKLPDYDGQLG
jgi:predicted secreted acid phosphatase